MLAKFGDCAGGEFEGAHLRGEVVGCHFWTWDEDAGFALVGGFHSAVEVVGDVGVLFRFGHADLG